MKPLLCSVVGFALCLQFGTRRAASAELSRLVSAIRAGHVDAVRHELAQGADVNARDATGTTPLMFATVYADVSMVSLLLDSGADVDARNHAGATALMWSVGNHDKARLLLENGADVNVATKAGLTALIMAATLPDAAKTVRLLVTHGADVNANAEHFSPLMSASFRGDTDVLKVLIEKGADATARNRFGFSPLHGASFNGTVEATRLLLSKRIDANVEVEGFTPAMWAAVHGKTEALRLLVAAGAKLNVQQDQFGTTPLMWASTTGHADTIRFLVRNGADVNVRDAFGNTPLSWARRRGDKRITEMLEKAGGTAPPVRSAASPTPVDSSAAVTNDAIRAAIGRSLPLLQSTSVAFLANGEGCVSCHHQSLPAMAVGLARQRGFPLDEQTAAEQRQAVLDQLDEQREDLLQGFGAVDVLDPAYFLTGLAAEGQESNRAIDAAVCYLLGRQRADGSWRNVQHRPPLQQSDIVNTALGIRSLQVYGLPGRSGEIKLRMEKARDWLANNNSSLPHDAALRLLGLHWADASPAVIEAAAGELASSQHATGGWSQLPSLPPDSYATGSVLVALHIAGGLDTDHPDYQRGVRFLLRTQLADGSWFVQTRSFPVQTYFETDFPHERSQFISTAATAWSTMALLHACERK